MFTGEYQYKVDEKGRVPFPPKFREQLKEGLILARSENKCISVYPVDEWKKLSEQWNLLPPADPDELRYRRLLFGTAFEAEFDGQGRIGLPAPLRQHADIGNTVVLVGANNCMEIWNKENWDQESTDPGKQMADINKRLARRKNDSQSDGE